MHIVLRKVLAILACLAMLCTVLPTSALAASAIETPTDPQKIIEDAFKLKEGETLGYEVTLSGKIFAISTPYDAEFGNITFVIEIDGKRILCYRAKPGCGMDASGIGLGDTITVTGNIQNYLGTVEFYFPTIYTRELADHVYVDSCDLYCNVCDVVRVPPHEYSNACDTECNNCGAIREVGGHIYDNDCDTFCNICNAERRVFHFYRNFCDTNCAVCGAEINPPHKFSDNCDIDCNLCGAVREIAHSYYSACDAYCNVCNTYRVVPPHVYTNNCDRDCNVCGATRKAPHTYSNDCDKSCNRCKAARTVAGHEYKKVITKATTTKDGKIKNVCAECGYTSSKVTTIYKASKISLSKTSYTYNGKAQKPSVVVKDSKGKTISSKYYTVTYASGRKNVGTYKVTIKFKGNYSGTKTLTFKIIPRAASISKLTAKSKAITVKLNRSLKQSTGYEVQYSTSKSFSSAKTKIVKSYKTSSLSLTGLKAKKTYYVRVRTYKTVNGKKVYSNWSTAKSVKTK